MIEMRILIVDDNKIALTVAAERIGAKRLRSRDGDGRSRSIGGSSRRLVPAGYLRLGHAANGRHRVVPRHPLRGVAGYVYVILLTGHNLPEEKVEGLRAGADDFISKPFNPSELIARIQTAERILSIETRDVAIFAMARLAESRDPETGAHLERVRSYSRILAQHLSGVDKFRAEINAEYVRLIYLTSPLHDIGKVGIPDCVLLKPGRLNDREFAIMKTHTSLGAQTLDAALLQVPRREVPSDGAGYCRQSSRTVRRDGLSRGAPR